ncbi:MAG: hypothetical protein J5806_06575 [Lentisphaeria bacterium]|nr:hypothetical protein [Lentisphaeria bacterium]
MKILSNSEEVALIQAREAFQKACDGPLDGVVYAKQQQLQEHVSCIKTAIDSFGSATFIVSCVGMLKSGKSTLVNLFSRNDLASPTGYGFDTTLRPALITDCEDSEGHIEIWLSNNPSQPLSKALFDKLFFHLRGVGGTDRIPEFTCHSYALNKANLINALCKVEREAENNMLPTEPALVVVKVPRYENSLLSSEIMILDTPGLDSGRSEWTTENSERYSWIISNSDLLLFLQSSVSPLNLRAATILHDIREHNPSTPVWLIQNEMILKPWLPKDRIREATEEQRRRASEMFNRISHAFKQINANLGEADSAVFDETIPLSEREDLWNDSQFSSMEKNIQEDLRTNIGPIRRANCKSNVLREIKQMNTFVDQLISETKLDMECLDKNIREMENFKTQLSNILLNPPQKQKFSIIDDVSEIETLTTIPFKKTELIKLLQNAVDRKFSQKKYWRSQVEKIIQESKDLLVEKIRECLRQTRLKHFVLNINGVEYQNEIVQYFRAKFTEFVVNLIKINFQPTETFRETMDQLIRTCSAEIKLPPFPDEVNVDVRELDHIQISVNKKNIWINSLWEIYPMNRREAEEEFSFYFDGKAKTGEFIKLINSCEETMKVNLLSWLNIDAFQEMRQKFIDLITERLDAEIAGLKAKSSTQDGVKAILTNMKNSCLDLKSKMEIFT